MKNPSAATSFAAGGKRGIMMKKLLIVFLYFLCIGGFAQKVRALEFTLGTYELSLSDDFRTITVSDFQCEVSEWRLDMEYKMPMGKSANGTQIESDAGKKSWDGADFGVIKMLVYRAEDENFLNCIAGFSYRLTENLATGLEQGGKLSAVEDVGGYGYFLRFSAR